MESYNKTGRNVYSGPLFISEILDIPWCAFRRGKGKDEVLLIEVWGGNWRVKVCL